MQTFILTFQENIFDVQHLVDFQRLVRAAKKCFCLVPCLDIIVHGEVVLDAAHFCISPVLSKEKSVC